MKYTGIFEKILSHYSSICKENIHILVIIFLFFLNMFKIQPSRTRLTSIGTPTGKPSHTDLSRASFLCIDKPKICRKKECRDMCHMLKVFLTEKESRIHILLYTFCLNCLNEMCLQISCKRKHLKRVKQ